MSLLMDALRKAERAKRPAAGEEGPASNSSAAAPPNRPEPNTDQEPALELVDAFASPPATIDPADRDAAGIAGDALEAVGPAATSPAGHTAAKPLARTVFLAKAEHLRRMRNRRLLVYGALGLVFGCSAGGYLYHVYRSMAPGSDLATGRVVPIELPPNSEPLVDDTPPGPAAIVTTAITATATTAAADAAPVPPPAYRRPEPGTPAPKARPTPASDERSPEAPAMPDTAAASPAAEPPARPAIAISRREGRPAPDPILVDAYAAFQRGDTAHARDGYRQNLKRDPDDRNALLGLAAIAARNGDTAQALAFYRRLLDRDPMDPLAHAGLMALESPADPVARESELKRLLAANPDAPPLHFALGNLYAAAQRWGDAQQAYFNALQADHRSGPHPDPDYPFNLAVALDHLGKRGAAADYYRRALALAAFRSPTFDPASARRRLASLEGAP